MLIKSNRLVFLAAAVILLICCKPPAQRNADPMAQAIALIREVAPGKISNTAFILSDKPASIEGFGCLENLLKDTITFSAAERKQIVEENAHPLISRWTADMFPQARLMSQDSISAIFKDRNKGWIYFNKHYGYNITNISAPVFLRNNAYCLLYTDKNCGYLCGSGTLDLYKKTGDKWEKIKTFCEWVS